MENRKIEEDRKLDRAKTLKKLQVAEVSLICTCWRRTEDYGEPRRFINMNCPSDDDDRIQSLLFISIPDERIN